ncbi:MAG TPA: CHRD domain-containing protein [Chloroflexia bacterium]|nr:CHRD domain-containing protein [Chloroflexia bacterium]
MKRFSILGVLILILATASMAFAQSASTLNLTMSPKGGSNVSGTATVTQAGNGITVTVNLSGFDANSAHAGHIHQGKCAGPDEGVKFVLNTINADASGKGSATTNVANATFAAVTDGNHYIQYHAAATPPGAGVTCADIPAGGTGQGGASNTPTGAPASGLGGSSQDSFPTWILLAGLAVVVVGAGASYTAIRQRNR